jgi:hypothetical protein
MILEQDSFLFPPIENYSKEEYKLEEHLMNFCLNRFLEINCFRLKINRLMFHHFLGSRREVQVNGKHEIRIFLNPKLCMVAKS